MPPLPKTDEEALQYANLVLSSAADLDLLKRVVSPDIIWRLCNGPEMDGNEGTQAFQIFLNSLTDMNFDLETCTLTSGGDKIVLETQMKARIRVDPSFTFYTIRIAYMFYLHLDGPHQGLVSRIHAYFDNGELLDRMGALGLV